MEEDKRFPGCMLNPAYGCTAGEKKCGGCGFDRAEAERRKRLPFVRGEDGLLRKIVKRKEGNAHD